jgi:fibronectin type 3 domain-containing protein
MSAPDSLTYKIQNINSVVLSWAAANNANSYKVYEVIDGKEVLKTTVTTLTATIANVPAGDHTYSVHSVSTRFGESQEGSKISISLNQQILAPADLTYSIANGNDITLKWTAAAYANSYNIYQMIDGQKSLKKTVTATSNTFTNIPAGNYDYVVTSVSSVFGESSNQSEVNFDLSLPVMTAPGNFAYKIQNINSVVLSWTASSYANNYKVYEVIDGKEVLKTTVTTLTTTIANLTAGDHTYSVHSVSTRFGESPEGSKVSLTLSQQMLPPADLAYTIANGNDITLKWTAASSASSYQVYQLIDGQKVLKKTVTTTSVTFANMPAGDYDYVVTSVSGVFGESANGSEVTFSLVLPTMAAPEKLAGKIQSTNNVVLTWAAVSYANSYKVYEVVDNQEVLKTTVTTLTATITNVSAGNHTYSVHSVSSRFGESQQGSQVSLNVYQQMLPPANLSYSITNGNDITLKWTAAAYANSYQIYQVSNGEKVLKKTVSAVSAAFTNMPGGNYDYIVTSVSSIFGESADGSEITFDLTLPVMAAPGNFTQSIANGNDITLKWNSVTYATAYRLYQIIGGQKSLLKTLTGTTLTLANMPAGDYTYEVDSYCDRFGESPAGSTINFTLTWPVVQAPVLNDSITNVNNITFSWPAVTWANEYRFYQVTEDSRKLLYSGTALSYKLYNLPEGTFNYEVTAYNTRFGESASSNRITENIIYPEMQAPTASIKLLNSTTALIYWNFITYANGYNVYELVDGKPVLLTENLNNLSYQTDNLSYLDHKFYVTSYSNSFGESQPSNIVIAKLDTEAPVTISDAPSDWVNQSPLTVTLSATDSKTNI